MAGAVAGVASAVRATPLDRWTAADPYLALLVHRAVLDARAAADDGERDALRIALERLSHALAALAEAEAVGDARTPKELARWLADTLEVPQRDLAALLGVDLRRFQRWISRARADAARGRGGAPRARRRADRRAAPPRLHARGRASRGSTGRGPSSAARRRASCSATRSGCPSCVLAAGATRSTSFA